MDQVHLPLGREERPRMVNDYPLVVELKRVDLFNEHFAGKFPFDASAAQKALIVAECPSNRTLNLAISNLGLYEYSIESILSRLIKNVVWPEAHFFPDG